MTRTLIFRAGALGDVVLTLPVIRAYRRRTPRDTIEVVGYPENWEVAGALVDRIHPIDSSLFAGLYTGPPSPALRQWLQTFDTVIAWTARPPAALLGDRSSPTVIHASPYPPPGRHAVDWLAESIFSSPGSTQTREDLRLQLTPEELAQGREELERLGVSRPVLVHPGAGAAWKRWPAERFRAVAESLRAGGHQVALVEGPADTGAVAQLQPARNPFPVVRDLPARRLAGVLAQGSAFLGNDSGTTHLAAAVGVPTVALFGPTDPSSWAPLGPVTVLRACTAGSRHQGQVRVCDDPNCLGALSTKEVLAAVERVLPDPGH